MVFTTARRDRGRCFRHTRVTAIVNVIRPFHVMHATRIVDMHFTFDHYLGGFVRVVIVNQRTRRSPPGRWISAFV